MNTVTSLLDHLCEGDIVDAADLARVSDTHPRSVARWRTQETTPRRETEERLLELRAVVDLARSVIRDDAARVWLNGEVVHDGTERRGFRLADKTFPPIEVHLRQGENRLLFKVGNFERDAWLAAHLVDEDGDRLFGIEYSLTGEVPTAVEEGSSEAEALPEQPVLLANYPNPFNPVTHIRFVMPHESRVRLDVYDLAGQRVRRLMDRTVAAGRYEVAWDGRDASGFNAASGVYHAVLRDDGDRRWSRAMTLIR